MKKENKEKEKNDMNSPLSFLNLFIYFELSL